MNVESKLADNGISIKNTTVGNKKTKCPQCQPPHDSHDNPLSVSINDDGSAVWLCHHCDWTGGTGGNNYQNNYVNQGRCT